MSPAQKSLVLVTVDCLRSDHCGFNGYSRATTPFLDTLAAESFVIPEAIIAGAPTYYSLPAIFASRMPLALGRDVVGLAPGEKTLSTALREASYATAAFSAANPYISPRFGYDCGFETFEDFLDFDSPSVRADDQIRSSESSTRTRFNQSLKRAAQVVGLGSLYNDLYFQYCVRLAAPAVASMDALRRFPSAEVIVDHAISWLASVGQRPFFLWLHLMDPHSPYYPSPAAFRDLTGRDASAGQARYLNEFWNRSDLTAARLQPKKTAIVDLYDAGIRSMDTQVARLVTHLKQSARWSNCALALTADHGEEFLDHGRRYHAPVSLHEEIVRVPLIIRAPESTRRPVPKIPFSHLHLAPTLLEILGVPAPESFRGTSLWPNLEQGESWDSPALTECAYGCTNLFQVKGRLAPRLLSVRDARHKLVIRLEPDAIEELYDLEADPNESRLLPVGVQSDVRKELLQTARRHLSETSANRDSQSRLNARLRDLRSELQSNSR